MRKSGATAVRASHYQQSESWYARCDRAGDRRLGGDPHRGNGALATPEFLENAKQQLRELIRQNFNHPSICFWGVGNETSGPAADAVIAALAARGAGGGSGAPFHLRLEPRHRRPEELAHGRRRVQPVLRLVPGAIAEFAAWLDRTHADYPKARFGMSEFGAGASIFQHAENPAPPEPPGPFHPEEYQNALPRGLLGGAQEPALRLGQVHLVPARLRLRRPQRGGPSRPQRQGARHL